MEINKIPFYIKIVLILIGLFVFISILFIAQDIIIPIVYSIIIAIVLGPLVSFFVKRKMNPVLSIFTSLLLVFIVGVTLVVLLSSQLSIFNESFPKLLEKFYLTINQSILWASQRFNIDADKLNGFVSDTKADILNSGRLAIGSTLTRIGGTLVVLVLIPVYVFMILYYQPLLLEFVQQLFGKGNIAHVTEIMNSTKIIIQRYMIALLFEAVIVAALNSLGLLLLGIQYAVVMGIIGALLNLIPYLGGIVAVALPMMVAFVTKDSLSYTFGVLALYIVVQLIDNNYVLPKLVASRVRINALISIIVVLIGDAIWGIPGMFLSIPLTAIVKVICDHIDVLKPWGFLLGDTMPPLRIHKLYSVKKSR